MTTARIQSFASLRDEMIAVAKGERKAPAHAAEPSVHSAEVIARLLTPENRELMSVIRDEQPASVAALAELTKRAPSNLTRTLDKLVAVGLVSFSSEGRRKAPRIAAQKIMIEIDPFSPGDKVHITPAPSFARKRPLQIHASTRGAGRVVRGAVQVSVKHARRKTNPVNR
jgi:predicted transcriptional regulator